MAVNYIDSKNGGVTLEVVASDGTIPVVGTFNSLSEVQARFDRYKLQTENVINELEGAQQGAKQSFLDAQALIDANPTDPKAAPGGLWVNRRQRAQDRVKELQQIGRAHV